MKRSSLAKPALIAAVTVLLCACATPPAKDFGGRWKPVNKYDDATVEIPLTLPYTYYAAPMDGTLKTMLTRWSADTGLKLNYKLRSDYTLPKAAASLHTSEARDAATQLSTIFAPQGVSVIVNGSEIVVAETSSIVTPPTASSPSSGAAAEPTKPAQAPVANAPRSSAADATPRTP